MGYSLTDLGAEGCCRSPKALFLTGIQVKWFVINGWGAFQTLILSVSATNQSLHPVNMDLSGKVAAVTGAARGLGKAYAEALLQKKAKVSYAWLRDNRSDCPPLDVNVNMDAYISPGRRPPTQEEFHHAIQNIHNIVVYVHPQFIYMRAMQNLFYYRSSTTR